MWMRVLDGNWGVPVSAPLGHLCEDVSPQILRKADSQNLKNEELNKLSFENRLLV